MKALRTLHSKHAILLGLALVGAIPYGLSAAGSLLAGGGIQVVNLRVLERGVQQLLLSGAMTGAGPSRAAGITVNLMRFAGFLLLVAWVLASTPVQPLAFGAGLMLVVPAAVWHGLERR